MLSEMADKRRTEVQLSRSSKSKSSHLRPWIHKLSPQKCASITWEAENPNRIEELRHFEVVWNRRNVRKQCGCLAEWHPLEPSVWPLRLGQVTGRIANSTKLYWVSSNLYTSQPLSQIWNFVILSGVSPKKSFPPTVAFLQLLEHYFKHFLQNSWPPRQISPPWPYP